VDERKTISTSSPWESIVGYSRAVRIGNYVSVSGTTSIDRRTGKIVGEGDAYMQTVKIIENIEYALLKARATLNEGIFIVFLLSLEPCHDVQLTFVFAHLRIHQNPFDGTSKILSRAYYILLVTIIHNQQGHYTWIYEDKHLSRLELKHHSFPF
jgi:Endoribonuclease L-PSP